MTERIERHDGMVFVPCPHSGNKPLVVATTEDGKTTYSLRCPSRYCSYRTDEHATLDAAAAEWTDMALDYPY